MAYHVSPNGPSLCHAKKGRCPYGADGENHFPTVAQATEFYENKMAEAFGGFEKIKKAAPQKRKERAYKLRDSFVSLGYAVKASPPARKAVNAVKAVRNAPIAVLAKVNEMKAKAWKGYSNVASFTRGASALISIEARQARARYSAYAARVSAENAILLKEYEEHRSAVNARRAEVKQIEANLGGKLRPATADKLQIGDKLENGTTISKLKTVNGATVVTTRNPSTGRFGKTVTLEADSPINVIRPRRQLMRQAGAAYKNVRTAATYRATMAAGNVQMKTRGAFDAAKGRVTYAAALQRQSFDALRGIDRTMIQNRQTVESNPVRDIQSVRHLRSVA